MEPVKITALEAENFKRLRVISITPTKDGLTVVGGRNGQGKTSVIDAIAWALGGNKKHRPDNPNRSGGASPAKIHIELSNGLVVERRGKNGALYVTDPTGKKGTQSVLDDFLSELAISLPCFLNGTDKERTNALLQTLGIDEQLAALDTQYQRLYKERTSVGQIAKRDGAYADSLPYYEDAPETPVSVAELVKQQQDILARNGENQNKRMQLSQLEWQRQGTTQTIDSINRSIKSAQDQLDQYVRDMQERISRLQSDYAEAKAQLKRQESDLATAQKTVEQLVDESTVEIEQSIANIEMINQKVQANQVKAQAIAQAAAQKARYDELSSQIEGLRDQRLSLLNGAPLPLPGLSVDEDNNLTYNGFTWSSMSGSEQLRVATAIVRATKPECGFVLLDKLEQMDAQTLADFGAWAQSEGLQVIGTRVSTGDECTVVIEDGVIEDATQPITESNVAPVAPVVPVVPVVPVNTDWGQW